MKNFILPFCFFIASISTSYAQETANADLTTHADIIPTGLVSGDTFRLLFVTRNTSPGGAVSSTARANTFVQDAANVSTVTALQGFSSKFRALVSTATDNARDNTDTNTVDGDTDAAIYWFGGDKVADNYADFYDGSWDSNSPRTENGVFFDVFTVFTGSSSDGMVITGFGIDETNTRTGNPKTSGKEINKSSNRNSVNQRYYGISPIFTVTGTAPVSPNAPTDISLSGATNNAKSIAENTTEVGTFTTTDADGSDTHTYTLVSGTGDEDNGKFTLDSATGVLSFTAAPDFEIPTDAGDTAGDNTYAIRVETTDGTTPFEKEFIITVTDVNEPTPPTIAPFSLTTENAFAKTNTLTFTDANNGDTLTAIWFPSGANNCTVASYNAVTGAGNGAPITLSGSSSDNSVGRMGDITYFIPEPDNPSDYNNRRYLCVGVTDGTNIVAQRSDNQFSGLQKNNRPTISFDPSSQDASAKQDFDLAINVTDSNADQTVTAKYKVIDSSAACEATTTDTGATDITAAIGSTNGKTVTITFNSEDDNDKKVCVNAEDNSGIPSSETGGISTTATPAASPTITGIDTTVPTLDNLVADQTATVATAFEFILPDNTFSDANTITYTSSGEGSGITFDQASKTWRGIPTTDGRLTITVTATDTAGNVTTDEFDIVISAANSTPTDITLTLTNATVDENQTVVGAFLTTDADASDSHTYALATGNGNEDNGKFALDSATGVIAFTTAPDHENPTDAGDTAGDNTYAVRVQTADQDGATFEKEFIITVTDVDEDDAFLSNLVVGGATISPTFVQATEVYTALVDAAVTSVTITPTVSHPEATVTVDGTTATSGSASTVTLSDGLNAIEVVVTAEDGTTTKTYTMNITKTSTRTITIFEVSDGYVNDSEDESTVTISGTTANIPTTDNLTITLTSSGNPRSVVIQSNGDWSFVFSSINVKRLTEGTITVTATHSASSTTGTQTFVYDATAPATPTLSITDTGSDTSDRITNNPTVTVAGLEANATWEHVAAPGSWTVGTGNTFNLEEISVWTHRDYSVRQADQAGNVSPEGTINVLYDATAPALVTALPDQIIEVQTTFRYRLPTRDFPTFVDTDSDTSPLTYTSSGEGNGITFSTNPLDALDIKWEGTPTTVGTQTITITATDIAGNATTDEFDFTISALLTTWTGTISSAWETAGNWSNGVPTSTYNVLIPQTTNHPTATNSVTVNKVIMHPGTSLIAKAAFNCEDITYTRQIDFTDGGEKGWYLMASPVGGETYDIDYIVANSIAEGTEIDGITNRGIATFRTFDGRWEYFRSDELAGTFLPGRGYSIKKNGYSNTSTISFTGDLITDDNGVNVVLDTRGDRFNLLGNPYPSYLNSVAFLSDLNQTATNDTQSFWVWNRTLGVRGEYEVKNLVETLTVAPGQGFFVRADEDGGTFNFKEERDQTHNAENIDTFQKSLKTQIKLDISDGDIQNYCKIYYLPETTTGFDVGYDGELFGGAPNPFAIYTHLVSDSEGINYQIQSLPYSDIENMVIPIGINAVSGREITITADVKNFPDGVHLYLEDKLENSVTQLSKNDAKYTVTLSDNLEGIGRFFLRASSSDLGDFSTSLENISVYTSSKNNLRIVGIQDGDVKLRAYNILGAQIIDTSFKGNGKNDVAIPNLAAGIYIVHLEMATGKISKKVVVE